MALDKSATKAPKLSSFRRAWDDQVLEHKISIRQKKDMAKCDTCTNLRQQLKLVTLSNEGRSEILKTIVAHKRFVRGVRREYYVRRQAAIDNPHTHASIIIGERVTSIT